MPLKRLKQILFTNILEDEVSDVVILYCESTKSIHNWYEIRLVDVETLKNVLWFRFLTFQDITIGSWKTASKSAENVCFGENFGYWQLYFTYKGDDYRLEKNNCKFTLSPECDQNELRINLSSPKGDTIVANFQILSLSAEFKVAKGKPAVRRMKVWIRNHLEKAIDFIRVVINEDNSSKETARLDSNSVGFDKTFIEPNGSIISEDILPYDSVGNKQYLKLYFTYEGNCYEIQLKKDDHGIPITLTEQDHKNCFDINILQSQSTSKFLIEVKNYKNVCNYSAVLKGSATEAREIISKNVSSIRERFNIEKSVTSLIDALRSLSNNIRQKDTSKKTAEENGSRFLFNSSWHPKLLFNEMELNGIKIKILRQLHVAKILQCLRIVLAKLESIRTDWIELNESLINLNNLLESAAISATDDDGLLKIVENIEMVKSMNVIDVLCKILIPSGLDEIGLTFYTSKSALSREISIDPGNLSSALEEELKLWKLSLFCNDGSNIKCFPKEADDIEIVLIKSVIYQKNLDRMAKLFVLLRTELVDNLENVAAKLHLHGRNVNISKVASSSAGIVGAGFAISGIVLAPITAGVSLALVATGIAVGATSGVVGVGTAIADGILTKHCFDSTVFLAGNDHYVSSLLYRLQPLITRLNSLLQDSKIFSNLPDAKHFHRKKIIAESIIGVLATAGAGVSVIAFRTGIQVTKAVAARFGSAVILGVISDLTTIAFKSIKLSKGGSSELGYKLEADALLLNQELEEYCSAMAETSASSYGDPFPNALSMSSAC